MIGKVEVLLMRPLQRGPARRITTLHAFALPAARHGDPLRRRGPVRPRSARALLGARRAAGAQARHLHGPAACGPATRARPDLVVLRRPEGLQAGAGPAAPARAAGALRPHLPAPHRVRHPRPAAGPAARQQGGAAAGPGAARGAAAHQRLGAGPAPAGGQAEDLRRHALGGRARVPGRVPGPAADLRQAGRVVLGLPRPPPWRARGRSALLARLGQAPLSARLTARTFAPQTPGQAYVVDAACLFGPMNTYRLAVVD